MQTIYRYEWGERVPDERFLQAVAEKTGISLDWLKGDDLNRITPVEGLSHLQKNLPGWKLPPQKNPPNDARKWMGMGFMTYDPQLKLFLIVLRSVP